jgi:hypothetical protein
MTDTKEEVEKFVREQVESTMKLTKAPLTARSYSIIRDRAIRKFDIPETADIVVSFSRNIIITFSSDTSEYTRDYLTDIEIDIPGYRDADDYFQIQGNEK